MFTCAALQINRLTMLDESVGLSVIITKTKTTTKTKR